MDEDHALLRRYVDQKSEAAFAELVKRHVGFVYACALRRVGGDSHLAEDVTQQVFIALARLGPALIERTVLTGWLYVAVRNVAAQTVRTERRRRAREHEAHAMNEATTETTAEWDQLRPVLDASLDDLSDRDRTAVLLRFFEGRSFAEVGARLRLNENAARMRVERALEKMQALLARRGVTSTSAALAVVLANQGGAAAPAGLAASVTGAALSGAVATGVSATAGALILMSMSKITAGIAGTLVVAAIGVGGYQYSAAAKAEAALEAAAQVQTHLRSKLGEAENRAEQAEQNFRAAETRMAGLEKTIANVRSAGANAKPAPVATAEDPMAAKIARSNADKMMLNSLRMTNPDVMRLGLLVEKADARVKFAPLYRSLNLTPEQIARFEDRYAERLQTEMDIYAAAQAKGISPVDPLLGSLVKDAQSRWEESLRVELGDAAFADYQRHARTLAVRNLIGPDLANLLQVEPPPTAQQSQRLMQIVADSIAPEALKSRNPNAVNWEAVAQRADGAVSPDQLAVVRALAERAKLVRETEHLAMTLLRASGGGPPAAVQPPPSKPPGS